MFVSQKLIEDPRPFDLTIIKHTEVLKDDLKKKGENGSIECKKSIGYVKTMQVEVKGVCIKCAAKEKPN